MLPCLHLNSFWIFKLLLCRDERVVSILSSSLQLETHMRYFLAKDSENTTIESVLRILPCTENSNLDNSIFWLVWSLTWKVQKIKAICANLRNLDYAYRLGAYVPWTLISWVCEEGFVLLRDHFIQTSCLFLWCHFKKLSAEGCEMYALKMMMHGWHVTDPVLVFTRKQHPDDDIELVHLWKNFKVFMKRTWKCDSKQQQQNIRLCCWSLMVCTLRWFECRSAELNLRLFRGPVRILKMYFQPNTRRGVKVRF